MTGTEDAAAFATGDSVSEAIASGLTETIASGLGVALASASVASSAGGDNSAIGVALGASGAALASEPALCVAWEHPEISAQQTASRATVSQILVMPRS
jgi:hypothetical protein